MDCVEDSGFDSDQQKPGTRRTVSSSVMATGDGHSVARKSTTEAVVVAQIHAENLPRSDLNSTNGLKQAVEIHRKPVSDKQRSAVSKFSSSIISQQQQQQQQQRHVNPSRNRLLAPSKLDISSSSDTQPLVVIDMDDSEDEFAHPKLSKKARQEITQQLIKDGYNLDLEPDDDDLDLIPPRPLNERCICCNAQVNCCIQ